MGKETAAKVDDALLDGLQQARKQKPRYYLAVSKGLDIVGLIVQKKPIHDNVAQKAKTESKGTGVIQGVCHGDGTDLKFEVLEKEPSVPTKRLKDFIAARTELTLKPVWALVPQLTPVPDEESPSGGGVENSSGRETATPDEETESSEPRSGGEPSSVDPAAEWKAKLAAWLPAIRAAIEAKGPTAGEIGKLLTAATTLSKSGGDVGPAIVKLAECHALAVASKDLAADLEGQCKRLKAAVYPLVKEAVAAHPSSKDEVVRLLGLADKHEKAKDFVEGIKHYRQLGELIASLKTTAKETTAPPPQSSQQPSGPIKSEPSGALSVAMQGVIEHLLAEITATLDAKTAETQLLPKSPLLTEIGDRLTTLRAQAAAATKSPAADDLRATVGELQKIAAEAAGLNPVSNAVKARGYRVRRAKYLTSIKTLSDRVTADIPALGLRALVLEELERLAVRLVPVEEIASPEELETRWKKMTEDYPYEIPSLDPGKVVTLLTKYQADFDKLSTALDQKTRAIQALPPSPSRDRISDVVEKLRASLPPVEGFTDWSSLNAATKALSAATSKLNGIDPAKFTESVARYEELLSSIATASETKSAEAESAGDPNVASYVTLALGILKARVVPLEQVDLAELAKATTTLGSVAKQIAEFDIAPYAAKARQYASFAQAQALIETAVPQVEALPESDLKSLLQAWLTSQQAVSLPLAQVPLEGFDAAWDDLQQREAELRNFQLAEVVAAAERHEALVLTLLKEIPASIAAGAAHLDRNAQARLEIPFAEKLDKNRSYDSPRSLETCLANLTQLRKDLAEFQAPVLDEGMQKHLDRAKQKLAAARQLLDVTTDDELRIEAASALGILETILADNAAGRKNAKLQSSYPFAGLVPVTRSEQTRLLTSAIAGIEAALREPQSSDGELMKLEGGANFANAVVTLKNTLVAYGGNHKSITCGEALAIHRYTGDDYANLNLQRRKLLDDPRLELLNSMCDRALAKFPKYPAEAWPTFRAERAWNQEVVDVRYAVGNQFTTEIPWSTGARGEVALGSGATPKFIHIIYGKSGCDVAGMAANIGEGSSGKKGNANSGKGEVLFPARTTFKVNGREVSAPTARNQTPLVYKKSVVGGTAGLAVITTKLEEIGNG